MLTEMGLVTIKTKEVHIQKLGMGTLIAEKVWHSHFHHYWGKKSKSLLFP